MLKMSLILVDLQQDFVDPSFPQVGRLEKALCLPDVRRLLAYARSLDWQVVHVATEHSGLESLPLHLRKLGVRPYCLKETEGAEILDGLFAASDLKVLKTNYSGFSGTDLAARLADRDSLILAGAATDCCILHTALDATSHGKHVYIPYQAVSASSLNAYVFGLEAMAKSAAAVVDLETLLGSTGSLWDARLEGEELETALRSWFSRQIESLNEFRLRQGELGAGSAREAVARLEQFLAGRPSF